MRRLFANILLAGACLLGVVAATPSVIKEVSTNGDYKMNRQFTYEITSRENADGEQSEALPESASKEIASIMEDRLINSKISSYSVKTSGNDQVVVTFSADSETKYQQITTYLSFSGSFALVNVNNDLVTEDTFLAGKARLKQAEVNEIPTVLIPVNTTSDDYTKLVEQAREHAVEPEEEGGEKSVPIYFLYNYEEGDTYESLKENGKFEQKRFLTFDGTSDETLYEGKKKTDISYFAQQCGFQDANGNGTADPSEVRAAFDLADYYVNLINASALDYNVRLIQGLGENDKVFVNPNIELVSYANEIQMNSTIIATIAAVVIVSLLLVVFYRLGAMNIMVSALLASFLTFLFTTIMGLEYGVLTIVGLSLVALAGIVSGIIYCNKLKEETYKGRTLKKANSEASKKSLLPIIDIHITLLVIGLMIFLLGGVHVHAFGAILLLGSLISGVISTLGLKGLMWLATNATCLTSKYEVFGIESKNVPNHMAEEKQRYFGPYAEKDPTKKHKLVSIIAGALLAISVVGIAVSGSLNNGSLYKQGSAKITGSEVYLINTVKVINTDEQKADYTIDGVNAMLETILVYSENDAVKPGSTPHKTDTDFDKYITLKSYVTADVAYTRSESKVVEDVTENYYITYYRLTLNKYLNGDKLFAKVLEEEIVDETTLNDVLAEYFAAPYYHDYHIGESGHENTISLKAITVLPSKSSIDWSKILLATGISIAILTVYFMLRYRLSRGLAMLIYPLASSLITLGLTILFSLIGLTLPSSISIMMSIVTFLTYAFMILVANKERDLLLEDKVKDNTYEHRTEVAKKALGMALTPVLATLVIGLYLLINYFGFGPSINSYLYIASIIGVLISCSLVVVSYIPLSNLFIKWFANIKMPKLPKKNKKQAVVKKSAEPEEAIFIGIND